MLFSLFLVRLMCSHYQSLARTGAFDWYCYFSLVMIALQVNLRSRGKVKEKTLDIGKVVKHSGLPASTLRYYEEKGLIQSVGRHGLRRLFDASVLKQLSLISLGRLAGLSLDEIGRMFAKGGTLQIDRELLLLKANELDQTINQLITMRDGLNHAAVCPEPSHLECPKFNEMLASANRRLRLFNKK
ncbi:MAG: DNA-binding transcriptional MerR regulator [Oleiphilaceae bacterium]|jgi:DNA-binding transcriptional MerR regulator